MFNQTAAAWVQAIGSIFAIVAAIVLAHAQSNRSNRMAAEKRANIAKAAATLSGLALAQVADRLAAAARPYEGKGMGLELREHRTTELVAALREMPIGDIPSDVALPFILLRSRVYAVNKRVSEIYAFETKDPNAELQRATRVKSALIVYDQAVSDFTRIRDLVLSEYNVTIPPLEERESLRSFVDSAKRAHLGRK